MGKGLVGVSLARGEHAEEEGGVGGQPRIGGDLAGEGPAFLAISLGQKARREEENRLQMARRRGDRAAQGGNRLVEVSGLEVAEGAVEILAGAGRGVLRLFERVCLAVAKGEQLADGLAGLPRILDRIRGMAATGSLDRFPRGNSLWLKPRFKGFGKDPARHVDANREPKQREDRGGDVEEAGPMDQLIGANPRAGDSDNPQRAVPSQRTWNRDARLRPPGPRLKAMVGDEDQRCVGAGDFNEGPEHGVEKHAAGIDHAAVEGGFRFRDPFKERRPIPHEDLEKGLEEVVADGGKVPRFLREQFCGDRMDGDRGGETIGHARRPRVF